MPHHETDIVVEYLKFLLRIQEVLGSNLSPEIRYVD
jgi:hypothetical protein